MYKNILAKTILTKIKNNYMPYSLDRKIENTINDVFKNNEDINKNKYIEYIKEQKTNFETFQSKLKTTYDPEKLNQKILQTCTCHTIIKKDLFYEIKKQLPKFAFIDDAIDAAIAKISFSEKEKENLILLKTELIKQFNIEEYKKYIRKADEDTTSKIVEDGERDRRPYSNSLII
jgi:hypothetical protein